MCLRTQIGWLWFGLHSWNYRPTTVNWMCRRAICINSAQITKSKRVLVHAGDPPGACQPYADNCEKSAFFHFCSLLLFIMSPLLFASFIIRDLPSSLPSISMWLWRGWSRPSSSWSFTPRALAPHPAAWETICDPTAGPNKRGPCLFKSTTHFLQRLCRLFYHGEDGCVGVFCWFNGKTDGLLL